MEKVLSKKINKTDAKANFEKWFRGSKVVDDDGNPLVVYHATTHKFYEFTKERGNIENHIGLGYYFTDSKDDATENYLSAGTDLTNRIEQLADRLTDDGIAREKARLKAEKLLKGKHEIVLPFYLKFLNPINLTNDKDATRYDALETEDEDGNYVENDDSLPMKLYEAIRSVSYEFSNGIRGVDFQSIFNDISSGVGDFDYAKAYDVDKAFRSSEQLIEVTDDEGNLASNEFIRRVYEEMGFDGVIMDAYNEFGGGRKFGRAMNMQEGTRHYIAFDSTQIKLANGKNTTFDGNNPDIRFDKGGEIKEFEYTIGGL